MNSPSNRPIALPLDLPEAPPPPRAQRSRVLPAPRPGRLGDLLCMLGAPVPAGPGIDGDFEIPLWRVRSGGVLMTEGARPQHLYIVRSGTFKSFRTLDDGYEQVLAFLDQGDVLGFEALCGDREPASVSALDEASVYVLPLTQLDAWRHRFPALDHALQIALSSQMARAAELTQMLAAVAAEVRLARFLLWLSMRMAGRGQSPRRFVLRMSRRDIASWLGVAHETVSRAFGTLAQWGVLSVDNREIEIRDHEVLKACARSTRRTLDLRGLARESTP